MNQENPILEYITNYEDYIELMDRNIKTIRYCNQCGIIYPIEHNKIDRCLDCGNKLDEL